MYAIVLYLTAEQNGKRKAFLNLHALTRDREYQTEGIDFSRLYLYQVTIREGSKRFT